LRTASIKAATAITSAAAESQMAVELQFSALVHCAKHGDAVAHKAQAIRSLEKFFIYKSVKVKNKYIKGIGKTKTEILVDVELHATKQGNGNSNLLNPIPSKFKQVAILIFF